MSASFPSAIKTFINPSSSSEQDSPSHSQQHIDANDEITAIETQIGKDLENVVKKSAIDTDPTLSADSDDLVPSQRAVLAFGAGIVAGAGSMPIGYLDTDASLSNNSDARVTSQKAIKTYVDGKVISKASTAEAEAATDDTKFVTPAGVKAEVQKSGALTVPLGNLPTISIAKGGTGQTTAQAAIDALLPGQGAASGKYLKSDGSNCSWASVDAMALYLAGTIVEANAPTDVTGGGASPTYVKIKEFSPLLRSGTVTVYFAMAAVSGTAYGKIYKNGAAAGTERSIGSGGSSWSEDISVSAGDVLQIYGHAGDGANKTTITDFQIRCSNPTVPGEVS